MAIASKPAPKGWPRMSSGVNYLDARKAIDWLQKAFGFEVQLLVEGEGGRIEHSELVLGGGMIMVGDPKPEKNRPYRKSPKELGGANTQGIMVYIDDCDAHCERARAAGAKITMEPETHDYGDDYWSDRTYECADLEGHVWWFTQRMRDKQS
jgi:uncharacterized glyoxalase superfamily protein PhnB